MKAEHKTEHTSHAHKAHAAHEHKTEHHAHHAKAEHAHAHHAAKHHEAKHPHANVMRTPKITRVVLSAGAVDKDLEKAKKLLELISERKAQITKSGPRMRIPAFGVKPKMELGTSVTLRNEEAIEVLRKLLGAIDNQLKSTQIDKNNFSFGIAEYINIPGMKYSREIGIRGFNVTVVFERPGLRVKRRKIKPGTVPSRQHVTREEIMDYMKKTFKTEIAQ